MLNSAQVKALFAQEAVLIGKTDGVPIGRMIELFGMEATQNALNAGRRGNNGGVFYNEWRNGENSVIYFYLPGFQYAASCVNVAEIIRKEMAATNAKVVAFPKKKAARR